MDDTLIAPAVRIRPWVIEEFATSGSLRDRHGAWTKRGARRRLTFIRRYGKNTTTVTLTRRRWRRDPDVTTYTITRSN